MMKEKAKVKTNGTAKGKATMDQNGEGNSAPYGKAKKDSNELNASKNKNKKEAQ